MINVFCVNSGQSAAIEEGTTIAEALQYFSFTQDLPPLAAKLDNVVEGLKCKLVKDCKIEYIDYTSYAGRSVYSRSLLFLLYKAVEDVLPGTRMVMHRPLSKGFFCTVANTRITPETVQKIAGRMRDTVEARSEFHRHEVAMHEAVELFERLDMQDKVRLLSTSGEKETCYYTLEGTPDIYYDVMLPNAGTLQVWRLEPYRDGMLLRVPDRHKPHELAPLYEQPKTFEAMQESLRWNMAMDLESVGDVNMAVLGGRAAELVQVSEALQERKVARMADEIAERYGQGVRLVLITGPTGSGKSTICKRLAIHLKACGLHTVSFSTDDYFVNRVETPLLPDGSYDFDNFETVAHDALQADLIRIMAGEEVEVPHYNFVTGIREYNGRRLKIGPRTLVLLEGIHALNPRLTCDVPQSAKYKIFINALTSLNLDDHNCISTSDTRLLRRILRDYNCGAFTARDTISHWPNVRRAEVEWIYPFQEDADVLFNSAYLVEFAVLRSRLEKVLGTIPPDCPEYCDAHRLRKFLKFFMYVPEDEVPKTSLLRSFMGE